MALFTTPFPTSLVPATGATARGLVPQDDPYQQLTLQEQGNLARSLFGGTVSFLGGVGSVLDTYTGASSVRDLLSGENPLDQLIDPFNESKRVGGREMLRHMDLVGDEDNWWNWGAGLAAEIALDPATYLTGGAGKFSKAMGPLLKRPELTAVTGMGPAQLRTAGTVDDFLKITQEARRTRFGSAADKATDAISMDDPLKIYDQQVAQQISKTDPTWRDYLHEPVTSQSGLPSGKAIEYLRAREGDSVGTLFRYMGQPVGTGAVAQGIAKTTDALASIIKNSSVGQEVQRVFNAPIQGITKQFSELGQTLARFAYHGTNESRLAAVRAVQDLLKERTALGFAPDSQTDLDNYRKALETFVGTRADIERAIDASDLIPDGHKEGYKLHHHKVHAVLKDLVDQNFLIGNDISEFTAMGLEENGNALIGYFPRGNEAARALKAPKGFLRQLFDTGDVHNTRRKLILGGASEGTVLLNTMFRAGAPGAEQLLEAVGRLRAVGERKVKRGASDPTKYSKAGLDEARGDVIRVLAENYGQGTLPQQYQLKSAVIGQGHLIGPLKRERLVRYMDIKGANGKMQRIDRYAALADHFTKYTDDELVSGIFPNDPLKDLELRLTRGYESMNVARSALRMMALHAEDPFPGISELAEGSVPIGDLLKEPNFALKEGDSQAGALSELARQMASDGRVRPLHKWDDLDKATDWKDIPESVQREIDAATAKHGADFGGDVVRERYFRELAEDMNADILDEVRGMHVPVELVETFKRLREGNSTYVQGEGLSQLDSYTAWFKAINTVTRAVPPVSAFGVRNGYAGQAMNFFTGNWSMKAFQNSWRFWAGKTVDGASQYPAIRQRVQQRALDAGENPAQALARLTDEEATEVLRDIVLEHNVLGPQAGHVDMGAMREEGRVLRATPQRFEARPELEGDTFAQQLTSFVKDITTTLTNREGLTWDPRAFRGVASDPITGRARILGRGAVQQQTTNRLGVAGESINGMWESMNRGTPFFHQLERGIDPAEAALRTNALQVDYSWRNYTDIEKKYLTRFFPFYKWCTPTDHEILTRRGWKTVFELIDEDETLSLDHENNEFHWVPIEEVATFACDEDLLQYTNHKSGATFQFTQDHSWPVLTRERTWVLTSGEETKVGGLRKLKKGYELSEGDRTPCAAPFHGTDSILSPRLSAILGWVVTDGYHRWRGNHCEMLVYQKKQPQLQQVIDLLGTEPRAPHPDTGTVPIPVDLEDQRQLTKVFTSKKDLPEIVAGLSREAAEAMYDAMMAADGTTIHNHFFAQRDPHVRDAFQILCLLTDRSPGAATESGCSIKSNRYVNIGRNLKKVPYKGIVWCPTTKYGTWVMRHNGAVVVTGNTRGMFPVTLREIVQRPGGPIPQAIRAQNRLAGDPDEYIPDYIKERGAVVLTEKDDLGTQLIMSNIDMPWSGATEFLKLGPTGQGILPFAMGTVGGSLQAIFGSGHPIAKAAVELATGKRLWDGRDLKRLDGGLQRIYSNISAMVARTAGYETPGFTGAFDSLKSSGAEHAFHALIGSPINVTRSLTDLMDREASLVGLGKTAANLGLGIRITRADLARQATIELLQKSTDFMIGKEGVRDFSQTWIPQENLGQVSPEVRGVSQFSQTIRQRPEDVSDDQVLQNLGLLKEGPLP